MIVSILILMMLSGCGGGADSGQPMPATHELMGRAVKDDEFAVNITVNGIAFEACIYNTPAGRAFAAMMPLKVLMSGESGERSCTLNKSLPALTSKTDTIAAGEIMLFGTDNLLIFCRNTDARYSYTEIGYIRDPSRLSTAFGNGEVTVAFERKK